MSTIKLKKTTAAAADIAQPSAPPAAQPAAVAPTATASPAPAASPVAAVPVSQPAAPAKSKEQQEYEDFQKWKAAQAAAPASEPTPEQAADVIMAPQIVTTAPIAAPIAAAPAVAVIPVAAPAVISTPEDAAEARALSTATARNALPGVSGAWGNRHVIMPRLQIVQGQGDLSKRQAQGTLLLQDEVFLAAGNATSAKVQVRFVPIELQLRYRERVDQHSGLKPRIAYNLDDVKAMGGTIAWDNNVRPNWDETARITVLLQQPEGIDHPSFETIEGLEGKYCPAVYYAAGAAFAYFAKVVYTASVSTLKVMGPEGKPVPYLPKRWWKFAVDTRRWGNFSPFTLIPNQLTEDTNEVVRLYVEQFVGAEIVEE